MHDLNDKRDDEVSIDLTVNDQQYTLRFGRSSIPHDVATAACGPNGMKFVDASYGACLTQMLALLTSTAMSPVLDKAEAAQNSQRR
jgi:hypothetical protein